MSLREWKPQLLSFKIQVYLNLTCFFYPDPFLKKSSQTSSILSSHLVFPWWNSLSTAGHLRWLYILGVSLPLTLACPKTLKVVGYKRSILWPASKATWRQDFIKKRMHRVIKGFDKDDKRENWMRIKEGTAVIKVLNIKVAVDSGEIKQRLEVKEGWQSLI